MNAENPMLIDVNASLGHWPFRLLRRNTPETILPWLEDAGVRQAWTASLDAVLNREPKTANLALAEATEAFRPRLVPFAVINPALPSWERDVDLYLNELGMAGFRVYPNYHQYALDAGCFRELLACAAERGVPLQIAVRLADERMHHPLVKTPAVELPPLQGAWDAAADAKLILLNVRQHEFPAAIQLIQSRPNGFVEISHLEIIGGLDRLVRHLPAERILFGTHAPLLYPHSAALKLRESDLPAETLERIGFRNAAALVPDA